MAQAWALKISGMHGDDAGRLYVSYDVFVQKDDGTVHFLPTTMEVVAGITPQQFRVNLTAAMLYDISVILPGTVLTAQDCMVDVVQRGA